MAATAGPQNVLVHLLGFPGTGKYTIAQEMARQSGMRLVDHHLINNPVLSLLQLDGKTPLPPEVWENTRKIWEVVKDTMVNLSPRHFSFVMTNFLCDGDAGDKDYQHSVRDAIQRRGGVYIPVRLLVTSVDEHVKRITAPDIDVASTILSYAADSSADLIVMGGYGHSRLREFVLGGATRGILESMTVPVLMSH